MKKSKDKLIDGLLLIIVITAIGFIVSRFTLNDKPAPTGPTGPSVAVGQATLLPPGQPADQPQQESPVLQDADWGRLMSDANMKQGSIELSNTCKDKLEIRDWGLVTLNALRISQLGQGIPQTISGLRSPPCVAVGQEFHFITHGKLPGERYVRHVATTVVRGIVHIKIDQIPDLFFQLSEVTRAEFRDYLARKRDRPEDASHRDVDTIVRVAASPAQQQMPDTYIPRAIFGGRVVPRDKLSLVLSAHPNAVLVDVRSGSEFSASPNEVGPNRLVNIPFSLGTDSPSRFSWNKTVAEIASAKFDFSSLQNNSVQTIVVLSSGKGDGRAYWAASSLSSQLNKDVVLVSED